VRAKKNAINLEKQNFFLVEIKSNSENLKKELNIATKYANVTFAKINRESENLKKELNGNISNSVTFLLQM
jgi:hypothetical protein